MEFSLLNAVRNHPQSAYAEKDVYADYISDDVITAFKDQHKVDVQVVTFETDDEAVQQLQAGQLKPDLFLSAASNSLPKLVSTQLSM